MPKDSTRSRPSGADADEAPVVRQAALFRNGRNQAVRIPRELELPGREVLVRRVGESLVLTPLERHPLAELLAGWEPLDETWPDLADPPLQRRRGL